MPGKGIENNDTVISSEEESIPVSSSKNAMWLGIGLTVTILLLVIFIPCPSASQYFVFRIIIALAAAGLAAVIPGIFKVNLTNGVTAGGAMGIFAVVFFFAP